MSVYRSDENLSGCAITVEDCDKSKAFCVVADDVRILRRRLTLCEAETLCSALALSVDSEMDEVCALWRKLESRWPPCREGERAWISPEVRSNTIAIHAANRFTPQ